eukprot:6499550-Heterocapsa_arctica.AAC.1
MLVRGGVLAQERVVDDPRRVREDAGALPEGTPVCALVEVHELHSRQPKKTIVLFEVPQVALLR